MHVCSGPDCMSVAFQAFDVGVRDAPMNELSRLVASAVHICLPTYTYVAGVYIPIFIYIMFTQGKLGTAKLGLP